MPGVTPSVSSLQVYRTNPGSPSCSPDCERTKTETENLRGKRSVLIPRESLYLIALVTGKYQASHDPHYQWTCFGKPIG